MKEDGRIVAFSAGLFLIRLVIGVVLFARGSQILFYWWTGIGMEDYAAYLDLHGLNFLIGSHGWAWVFGLVQFVGGILIIFGLMTRLSALLNALVMLMLLTMVEYTGGFFMVLYGWGEHGETVYQGGIEYTLVLGAVLFGLFLTGAGNYSLDVGFAVKRKEKPAATAE
ncbi:DoxX family protein [bacterium]|nr:DoxX family protein [bacterium]